ncbi:MFS transporter [Parvibaculum sedimenti]|uniref:MFS transporter n=2 Tax=Parvibaculum sedimenti TaxID=2608632 RepID=A0A6N6VEQ9_9HYPH|nr:MFS transporter [Parvibaculum sedimenti]KAB7739055.1 MFS transporter [Parvibaculum sedimenti]
MAEPKHSALRLLAFAGPSIPIAALGLPLAVYLPPFYAGPMGLGLATVGTIFMLARIWDVVIDPVLGYLSDRFPSRWGRRRHWLVIAVPLLMVSSWFIFVPTAPVSANYLLAGLFGLYLGFTMMLLAHMSWGAELDDDYHERSRIQGWREGLAVLGVPLVLMLPAIIEKVGGEHVETARVAVMGWYVIIALPLTVFFAVRFMGERKQRPQAHLPISEAVKVLATNRALRTLVIADLASGFSGSALGAMFIYESSYVWQVGTYASLLLLLYFFAGVAFIPLVLKISYRLGKHRTMIGAALFNVLFVPTLFLIPPGNIVVASIVLLFLGMNVGIPNVLYRSIMADVGDYDEVHTGQRRTGLFYALLTLTAKVGSAVSIGVTYWALSFIGFQPGGENAPEVLTHLNMLYVAVPFCCNLFVAYMMWGFPIGLKEQQELRKILDERVVEEVESIETIVR